MNRLEEGGGGGGGSQSHVTGGGAGVEEWEGPGAGVRWGGGASRTGEESLAGFSRSSGADGGGGWTLAADWPLRVRAGPGGAGLDLVVAAATGFLR